MATTYARTAHQADSYWDAQALVAKLEDLAFHYGAGLIESADVVALAEQYEREAQDISWAAYAAGRGYAATTRVTGYAFVCAWDLATLAKQAA